MRLLPTPIANTGGLRVSADPRGFVVFVTPEDGAHLTPEQSLGVAFDLLRLHCPPLLAAIEREVRVQRLQLVQGGGDAA